MEIVIVIIAILLMIWANQYILGNVRDIRRPFTIAILYITNINVLSCVLNAIESEINVFQPAIGAGSMAVLIIALSLLFWLPRHD